MHKINFSEIKKNIVYVFYAKKESYEIPFYVGETSRGVGRFGDYISANFSASTDFKVGVFAKLLEGKGYEIFIMYESAENRKVKEKELINEFQKFPLINNRFGYKYKSDSKDKVVEDMKDFINENFK